MGEEVSIAADPIIQYMSKEELEKQIKQTQKKMEAAAKELDFVKAAEYRDELFALQKIAQNVCKMIV